MQISPEIYRIILLQRPVLMRWCMLSKPIHLKLKNFYADLLAVKALQILYTNLRPVLEDGHNMEARQNMLVGSMLAGQAFANSPVGAVHALAYPLGGHFHISHGHSNALVLLKS